MEMELQAGVNALVGLLVVPLTQQVKKWFGLEDSLANAIAATIVILVGVVGLNFAYGYGLNWITMLQTSGAMLFGVLLGNGFRKTSYFTLKNGG